MKNPRTPKVGYSKQCKTCNSPYRALTEQKLLEGHSVLCVSFHLQRVNWPTMWMSLATHWQTHMVMFRDPAWGIPPLHLHVSGVSPRIVFDEAPQYPQWQYTPYPAVHCPETQSVVLIRGLIGSGKTAWANTYAMTHRHLEADHYALTHDGWFRFSARTVFAAHEWCQNMLRACLELHESVVIANTFCENRDMLPYALIAQAYAVPIHIIDILPWEHQRDHHLHHKISRTVLNKQFARWQPCLLQGLDWQIPFSVQRLPIFEGRLPMPDLPYLCQPGVCTAQTPASQNRNHPL